MSTVPQKRLAVREPRPDFEMSRLSFSNSIRFDNASKIVYSQD